MNQTVVPVPDHALGFDCNTALTALTAAAFRRAGYRFAVRYVRRASPHAFDLTAGEADLILQAGLGLMVVQHVAPDGWTPDAALGSGYGLTAAREARLAQVLAGTTVWCDLEGVAANMPAQTVIDFCNRWHDAVAGAGFTPGLYVGFGCGLNASDLYRRLKFKSYWSAYNLNADNVPAVRGVAMRQSAMTDTHAVPGIPFAFDVNTANIDGLGGRVLAMSAEGALTP